jgi:hypothetical protein
MTPSAGAVAKAESAWNVLALRLNLTGEACGWFKSWHAFALDAFAREREAAVWEEMRPYIQHWRTCITQTCHPSDVGRLCNCGLDELLRPRAAEGRKIQ